MKSPMRAQIETEEGPMALTMEKCFDGDYRWFPPGADAEAVAEGTSAVAALQQLYRYYRADVWGLRVWQGNEQIWP